MLLKKPPILENDTCSLKVRTVVREISSRVKPLNQMTCNLFSIIYGMVSITFTHIVSVCQLTSKLRLILFSNLPKINISSQTAWPRKLKLNLKFVSTNLIWFSENNFLQIYSVKLTRNLTWHFRHRYGEFCMILCKSSSNLWSVVL